MLTETRRRATSLRRHRLPTSGVVLYADARRRRPAAYAFSAAPLTTVQRHRLNGSSWRPGCPVRWTTCATCACATTASTDRAARRARRQRLRGRAAMRSAFAELFADRFPIRRMRLVDAYGASDYRSIEADNTSAFNCRRATGATRWSEHAYGRAIDVNPIENPYVVRQRHDDPPGVAALPRPVPAPQGHGLRRRHPGPRRSPRPAGAGAARWPRPDRLPALLRRAGR